MVCSVFYHFPFNFTLLPSKRCKTMNIILEILFEKHVECYRFVCSWTGQMVGDIMAVVLRAGRFTQAVELLINLDKRQQEILGVPSIDSLTAFLDASIQNNNPKMAVVSWHFLHLASCGSL